MNNAPNIHREDPSSSNEVRAEVLFVDLDLTLIEGTAIEMSDEEIREVGIIENTRNLINKAEMLGAKIVMATRNDRYQIERVLDLRPDIASFFDDTLACTTKSTPINTYLETNKIKKENALFIDDTPGEISEVTRNSHIKCVETGKTDSLYLQIAA